MKLTLPIPMEHAPAELEAGGRAWICLAPRGWRAWFVYAYRKLFRTGHEVRIEWTRGVLI